MVDLDVATDRVRAFLRERLAAAGADGYVVGVSGGLDSALAATLAVDAVGAARVTGMVLPGAPSDPANMTDARSLCDDLDITWEEADVEPIVEAVRDAQPGALSERAAGNVRARARMVVEYAVANEEDLLVLGPDNRSEWLLGYFTKYGDGGVDVAPLGDLYKTEVAELARHVDLDERFVEKTPTAGLWEGQTDEGELGAPYDDIDPVLRAAVDAGLSVEETVERTGVDRAVVERLIDMVERSAHKRRRPPSPSMPREGSDP